MPAGAYDCQSIGNVSVQLGKAPYTVSMESGDQSRRVGNGDMVTVGWCKIYGPEQADWMAGCLSRLTEPLGEITRVVQWFTE